MTAAPVHLRPVLEADLPHLTGDDSPFENFGPRNRRTTPHDPSLTAELGGLAIIASHDAIGNVVGNVSWVWQRWGPNPQSRNPMIGIWLTESARSKGLGTKAQRMLVDLFFLHTNTHRVEAHTAVENLAERRALEKADFTRDGVIRGAQWREGRFHDVALYSILRPDWAAGPKSE